MYMLHGSRNFVLPQLDTDLRVFLNFSRLFLFCQAMCETDGEFPEESCISTLPTLKQHQHSDLTRQFNVPNYFEQINRSDQLCFLYFIITKSIQFLIFAFLYLLSGNIFSFVHPQILLQCNNGSIILHKTTLCGTKNLAQPFYILQTTPIFCSVDVF